MARLNDGTMLAYATMGGEGQPQTQAAIFTRHVVFGHDMQAAVSAPRWLLGRTRGESATNLKVESQLSSALVEKLRQAEHDVEVIEAYDDRMGHAEMVSIAPSGVISAANDPGSDGSCAGI